MSRSRGPTAHKIPTSIAGYSFVQNSPVLTWTINHNLGFNPTVELFTVGGVQMFAEVTHVSINQTVINFTVATAGTARLV